MRPTNIGHKEPGVLRQVLANEEARPREHSTAEREVRELFGDAIASTSHHHGIDDDTIAQKLVDELVKTVRARDTRWAFIALADAGPSR